MARILILGATSAIAWKIAQRHAARGDKLYLVGRSPEKLDALSTELGDRVIGSACADFDATDQNPAVIDAARRALGGIDLALIAHGYLGDQEQTERDYAVAAGVVMTNFLSAVSLIVALTPVFEEQGQGHLVVISSVAGIRGRPKNYTYGAAKSGLTTYLQGLRSRLWGKVAVTTIRLGPTDTPMTAGHKKNFLFATPERVARDVVHAADRKRGDVFVPWYWSPIMSIVRRIPEWIFQRLSFLAGRE